MDFIFNKNRFKENEFVNISYELISTKNVPQIFIENFNNLFCIRNKNNEEMIPEICMIESFLVDNGDYDFDDDWHSNIDLEYNYYPIKYCPFTGEKINIIINKTIDKTDECNTILKEIQELQKKKGKKSIEDKNKINKLYSKLNKYDNGNIVFNLI